jgi:hypothetical protein
MVSSSQRARMGKGSRYLYGTVADKQIIVDMLAWALDNRSGTLILISCDKDFSYACSVLRNRRYKVIVIAPSSGISTSLSQSADEVLEWRQRVLKLPAPEAKKRVNLAQIAAAPPPPAKRAKLAAVQPQYHPQPPYLCPSAPNHTSSNLKLAERLQPQRNQAWGNSGPEIKAAMAASRKHPDYRWVRDDQTSGSGSGSGSRSAGAAAERRTGGSPVTGPTAVQMNGREEGKAKGKAKEVDVIEIFSTDEEKEQARREAPVAAAATVAVEKKVKKVKKKKAIEARTIDEDDEMAPAASPTKRKDKSKSTAKGKERQLITLEGTSDQSSDDLVVVAARPSSSSLSGTNNTITTARRLSTSRLRPGSTAKSSHRQPSPSVDKKYDAHPTSISATDMRISDDEEEEVGRRRLSTPETLRGPKRGCTARTTRTRRLRCRRA